MQRISPRLMRNGNITKAGMLVASSLLLCAGLAIRFPNKSSATTLPVVHVSGTLASDTTWTSGNVYMVDSTVTVPSGITLTLNSGVIVKYSTNLFNQGITVDSGGEVDANGTSVSPVVFTEPEDDSAGGDSTNDGASTGSTGAYQAAVTMNGGVASIMYADFRDSDTSLKGSVGGTVNLTDSSFSDNYQDMTLTGNTAFTASLLRNNFDDRVTVSNLADATAISLDGSDRNTFSGSGANANLMLWNSTIPSGETWTVSSTSGVNLAPYNLTLNGTLDVEGGVLYGYYPGNGTSYPLVDINGTLNLAAGTIVKLPPTSGFTHSLRVEPGGALNADGTSTDQVLFTSYEDDSAGGDTNGDSSSSASIGDYDRAIEIQGGEANVEYSVFKYASTAVGSTISSSSLSVADSTFDHTYLAISQNGGSVSLQRNSFAVSPGTDSCALSINSPDLSGVTLTGSDANSFTGSGSSKTVCVQGSVPTSATWNIAGTAAILKPIDVTVDGEMDLGNQIVYAAAPDTSFRVNAITVNGELNVDQDTTFRLYNDSNTNAIAVNTGGTLVAGGTNTHPIWFTSIKDTSAGGDISGYGTTTPALGDYGSAVKTNGGSVSISGGVFKYGSAEISTGSTTGGDLTVNDSSFSNAYNAISHTGRSVAMQGNDIDVSPGSQAYAVLLNDVDDASTVVLSGINENIFSGSGPAQMLAVSGDIPVASSWIVDQDSNVILAPTNLTVDGELDLANDVTYAFAPNTGFHVDALTVNGILTIAAGSVLRMHDDYGTNGITVNTGGEVDVNGTSGNPAVFTSIKDQSYGGDITSVGSRTPSAGDYGQAIQLKGGSLLADHAVFKYASVAVGVVDGEANVESGQIDNDGWGLNVADGKVIYRGSITNVSKGVNACNWQFSCNVDAAYVDWGSADGPFPSSGDLACGNVTVNPWLHAISTYSNHNVFAIPACDSSDSPSTKINNAATSYLSAYNSMQTECDNGNNDVCDQITRTVSCIQSAWSLAGGTMPFSLPSGSPATDPVGYVGAFLDAAGDYYDSAEEASVAGLVFHGASTTLGVITNMNNIDDAYYSCLTAV